MITEYVYGKYFNMMLFWSIEGCVYDLFIRLALQTKYGLVPSTID